MQRHATPRRSLCRALPHAIAAVAGLVALGCGGGQATDRVEVVRSRYTASLNSFAVEQTPLATASTAVVQGEPVPIRQDVLLDILIQSRSEEPLAGLTLDVTQVDGEQREKGHYRIWVSTAGIGKGRGQSVSHRLEGVDYREGDGFHVEVRHPVPLAERGLYRELAAGG
jgi:hypothetical protein